MNILYLTFIKRNSPNMAGVKKKIEGQMKVFKDNFNRSFFTDLEEDGLNIWEYNNPAVKRKKIEYDKSLFKPVSNRKSFYKDIIKFIEQEKIDILYIRYRTSDPFFIKFLKMCEKENIKIYIEIATYPYDKEISKITTKIMDNNYSLHLSKYVHKIVTYSKHKEILGIETININNAIDIESIPLKGNEKVNSNEICLIAVANVNFWHGYDRIIEGLKRYYDHSNVNTNPVVKFIIVGEGKEVQNLKDIVKRYSLKEYVKFLGYREGSELNKLYNNADIGIASLGIHRLGLKTVSTLKSKEYWARGLPFIKSYLDEQIDTLIGDFILNISANDEPVNIYDIIELYNSFYENNKSKKITLRKLAEKNITWENQLGPVIKDITE